jgi:hypothetical protein
VRIAIVAFALVAHSHRRGAGASAHGWYQQWRKVYGRGRAAGRSTRQEYVTGFDGKDAEMKQRKVRQRGR